jgi:PilZ domain
MDFNNQRGGGPVIQDRRRSHRILVRQTMAVAVRNGGRQVSAFSRDISLDGAFIYCDRFLAVGSEVTLIIDLPPDITKSGTLRIWCEAKVLRISAQLTEGRFGIALVFTRVQPLPEA